MSFSTFLLCLYDDGKREKARNSAFLLSIFHEYKYLLGLGQPLICLVHPILGAFWNQYF
jgi:hypothetical protein